MAHRQCYFPTCPLTMAGPALIDWILQHHPTLHLTVGGVTTLLQWQRGTTPCTVTLTITRRSRSGYSLTVEGERWSLSDEERYFVVQYKDLDMAIEAAVNVHDFF